jgi:ABC-2 type transport system permease protein
VLVLFLLFAGFAGVALTLLVAPLIRLLSGRQLVAAGCAVVAGLGWMFLRSFNFWGMDGRNDLMILNQFLSHLPAMQSAFFPGQWAASAVVAAAANNHREVLFQGATLLANTLVFLPIFASYGTHYYGREWLKSHSEGAQGTRRATARRRRWLPHPINARARTPLEALVLKDVLVFVRDPAQLSQSLLFVLLMVIYSLSLLRIPEFTGQLRMIIHFANLLAVCMILSSFTSRFLFPLISLEGRSFWIVGLAPISRRYLVLQKAVFGLGISSVLGLVTVIVSNVSLRTPPDLFLGAVYATILAAVVLTFLATGLGAAFPTFDEDNPARIAVGVGGTLNFVASALAVALIIAIEAIPWVLGAPNPPLSWKLCAHAAATAFTVAVAWVCLRLGSRSIKRRDF